MNCKCLKSALTGMVFLLLCGAAHAQSITVNTKQDLDINRAKIDSLDNRIITILGERERIVRAIGVYKAKNNIPPLQAARFKEVLDNSIAKGSKEDLPAEFSAELMNAIHRESLRIEGDSTLMKQQIIK